MKKFVQKVLRLLMTPLRRNYQRRNGCHPTEERREMPNEVLLGLARDMIREGHTAVINVKGYSMRPFLEHCRDKVKLAPATDLSVGDAILAEIQPGLFVLHRIIRIEGDTITMMGDGNIRGTEQCRRGDVCGIVTEYIRPGRIIPATDPTLCRRIRTWRKLLPVRRWLLIIYKSII